MNIRNTCRVACLSFAVFVVTSAFAQTGGRPEMIRSGDEVPLTNWLVNFTNAPQATADTHGRLAIASNALPSSASYFIAIAPCRLVDTRNLNGPYGGPSFTPGLTRTFTIPGGPCPGIPIAAAYSLNFAIVNFDGGGGFVAAYPAGTTRPPIATVTFGKDPLFAVANAAIVPANASGAIDVYSSGNTQLIIDINGYMAEGVVTSVNGLTGAVSLIAGTDLTLTGTTFAANSASANTPNTLVRRDGSGNFSAGTVTLSGNLALPNSTSTTGAISWGGTVTLHNCCGNQANIFLGPGAGNLVGGGVRNTGVGQAALAVNNGGNDNVAVGSLALSANTTGVLNTAVGRVALLANTTGSGNIGIGVLGGGNLTTGGNNIDIGHAGVAAESSTMRIGTAGNQTRTFLAGVRGVTTGAADGLMVLVDSTGQLGTVSSSASVKRDITGIGEASSALLKLRPVSFLYRSDTVGIRQYGLIAEEVAEVMPELVQFSADGKAETVRYHFLAPLLLDEVQKQHETIEQQRRQITTLEVRLRALEEQLQDKKSERSLQH